MYLPSYAGYTLPFEGENFSQALVFLETAHRLLQTPQPQPERFLSSRALFVKRLTETILLNLAYVNLVRGNFEEGLSNLAQIHKDAESTKHVRQYSFLYAASAHFYAGRVKEAFKFLSKKFEVSPTDSVEEKRERERLL